MSTLLLASRNLIRAPRRTALTAVAVVAGVGVFIVGEGFLSGIDENIIMAAIEGTAGHVLVRPLGYPTQAGQHPVDVLLEVTPAVRALLDERAVAWTERTYFAPLAAAGRESLRVVAIGYDPDRDPLVFPRTHWKLDGRMPTGATEVAVGPRVARLLGLERGATLVLQVRTHQGAMNALEVSVVGVVATGNPALDFLGVFVPQSLTHALLATDQPSHLSVRLQDRAASTDFALALSSAFAGKAEVATWQAETEELLAIQQVRHRALDLVMFVLLALAAFGIANTILMAAYERVREIGTLRAMGMSEAGVVRLFLAEGAMIGALGSLAGAAWGGALVWHWARSPIDLSQAMERSNGSVSASALVYTALNPTVVVATVLVGVLVSVLSSIYPARVASRMLPADAVRAQ